MARTRTNMERDAKVGEIVDAAKRRLRQDGYEALSLAAIARELGLAQSAIYWYFPSKDHLFVTALREMLRDIFRAKPAIEIGEIERILWFTDQLGALSTLRGAMNERAAGSEVVAEFVVELDDQLQTMLANLLRGRFAPRELDVAVEAIRSTVQGTFLRDLDPDARREVLSFVLERLLGDGGGAPAPR